LPSRTERFFEAWRRRLPAPGELSLAALLLALATGVVLAAGYDVRAPGDSLQLLVLSRPAGRLLRAAHAWASHLTLVLAALHAIEHLVRRSDRGLRRALWYRVVLGVPLLLLAALTGFMLRGDADGRLARQVATGLLELAPSGAALSAALFGTGSDLQLVYVHHAATLGGLLLLLAIEHGRRLWPSGRSFAALAGLTVLSGVLFPPLLQAGGAPQGPWFFMAFQELLHWLPHPGWAWPVIALPLLALALLPWFADRGRRILLLGLALCALAWAAGTLVAAGRGARPRPLASATASGWLAPLGLASLRDVPEVLGRREGCLACHGRVRGIEEAHARQGCASCHLGDPFAASAAAAHRGMLLVPGNLDGADRSCGAAGCHGPAVERVRGSLMGTVRGMIAVNRFIFGEAATPDGQATPATLGESPADSHLRQLCVVCHLGTAKERPAPVGERSRGGGCVACHLRDDAPRTRVADDPAGFVHPSLSVRVRDESCFGCHSRSGRLSLSYHGWAEVAPGAPSARTLADGRPLERAPADVHAARGMACIDCHTVKELMGDGTAHAHEEQSTRVRCETCHRTRPPRSLTRAELDVREPEASAVCRRRPERAVRFLVEDRTGEPLTNAWPGEGATVLVRGKLDGKLRVARPPVAACRQPGHARVSCQSCHSPWAPRCLGCHTQHDPSLPGWVEFDAGPGRGAPALGVLARGGREQIEPVVPGMVLTINGPGSRPPQPLPASAKSLIGPRTRFVRAYALAAPHTTTKAGRSCASCHTDPFALGYGAGTLRRGHLESRFEASRFDGLPGDAWIAPSTTASSRTRSHAVATRRELRPLSPEEQRRTLGPGSCMRCHDPAKQPAIYRDFAASLTRRRAACRQPE
jgi:hypothetical protein